MNSKKWKITTSIKLKVVDIYWVGFSRQPLAMIRTSRTRASSHCLAAEIPWLRDIVSATLPLNNLPLCDFRANSRDPNRNFFLITQRGYLQGFRVYSWIYSDCLFLFGITAGCGCLQGEQTSMRPDQGNAREDYIVATAYAKGLRATTRGFGGQGPGVDSAAAGEGISASHWTEARWVLWYFMFLWMVANESPSTF